MDHVDKEMAKKGYNYKLVPVGWHDDLDPLYAKTSEQVKDLREDPPVKDMKFRVELL